jgi:hypothetical protein
MKRCAGLLLRMTRSGTCVGQPLKEQQRGCLGLKGAYRQANGVSGRDAVQRKRAKTGTRTTHQTMNQSTPAPVVLHTPGFAHSNVAWSPFHNTRIAIASSANYGIIGNGRLNVASTLSSPSGTAGIKLDKLSELNFSPLAVKLMPSSLAMKHKMAYMTLRGQRSTRTNSSQCRVMVP